MVVITLTTMGKVIGDTVFTMTMSPSDKVYCGGFSSRSVSMFERAYGMVIAILVLNEVVCMFVWICGLTGF